jgi:energy-coupling factor transporter transmembrane protein EcfT
MHPAGRILLYLLSALALPGLNVFLLGPLALLLFLLSYRQRGNLMALLKRARWLFLLLFLAHAYQLPGEPLWQMSWLASPTREGMLAGLLQCARLLVMLALLDVLVLSLPTERLVTGVYSLMRPFSGLGLDPRRAALRLGLTLHAMERRMGAHVLRDLVHGRQPGHDLPHEQALLVMSWQRRDGIILMAAGILLAVLWFSA